MKEIMIKLSISLFAMQILVNADIYDGQLNGQCKFQFPPYRDGYCFRSSACPGAVLSSLCPQYNVKIGCCILEHNPSYDKIVSNITLEMFTEIFEDTIRSKAHYIHFLRSLKESGVTSCHQQSAYISQIAFDTNLLSTMEEMPDNLPLKRKNEIKYVGRGAIHIAGATFYEWLEKKIQQPVISQPETLAFPSLSFKSASVIWSHSYSALQNGPLTNTSYNKLADGTKYGFLLQSYYLRGHLNDVDELLSIWRKVNKALKCECLENDGPRCTVNGRQGTCRLVDDCNGKQAESRGQCNGPGSVVRCCLGFDGPIRIQAFLQQGLLPRFHIAEKIIKTLQDVTRASKSTLSIKTFRVKSKNDITIKEFPERTMKSEGNLIWKHRMTRGTGRRSFLQREIAVIVCDYRENAQEDLKLWTYGAEWSPAILILQIVNNKTIHGLDGITNQTFKLEPNDSKTKLTERIFAGPWFLPINVQMKVDLGRFESTYLVIPYENESTLTPLVSVQPLQGTVHVNGILSVNQLQIEENSHCSYIYGNDTASISKEKFRYGQIIVQYRSGSSNTNNKIIKAIILNSRAVIAIRGVDDGNIAELRVSVLKSETKAEQHKGTNTKLLVVISHLAVVLSCLVVIFILRFFLCSCRETELLAQDPHNQPNMSSSGGINLRTYFQPSENGDYQTHAMPVEKSVEAKKSDVDNDIKVDGVENEQQQSLFLYTQVQSFKAFSVLFFNTLAPVSSFLVQYKLCTEIIQYSLRYFSNVTYSWVIIEMAFGNETCLRRILSTCKHKRGLFHLILWGVPAVLSLIPHVVMATTTANWGWMNIGFVIEISTKVFFFLSATFLWTTNFIADLVNQTGRTFWCVQIIPLLFDILFTTAWALTAFMDVFQRCSWLTISCVAVNFILAIFVYTSVYIHVKQASVSAASRTTGAGSTSDEV